MNVLDYVLCGVLLLFLVYGYAKGFLRQVLQIAGAVLAFYLAARFHTALAESGALGGLRARNPNAALVASFVGILFASAAVLSVVMSLIGRKLKSVHLSGGNRWLGGFLGLAMGVVLLGGLAVGLREWKDPTGAVGGGALGAVAGRVKEKADNLVTGSLLVPYLADACLEIVALIPQEGRDELGQIFRETLHLRRGAGEGAAAVEEPAAAGGAQPEKPGVPRRLLDLGARRRIVKEESRKLEPVPVSAKIGEEKIEPATHAETGGPPESPEREGAAKEGSAPAAKGPVPVSEEGARD